MTSTSRFKTRRILQNVGRASARLVRKWRAEARATFVGPSLKRALAAILAATFVAGCTPIGPIVGASSSSPPRPWSFDIDAGTGGYSLFDGLRNWTFTSALGQNPAKVVKSDGSDELGPYTSVSFNWNQDGPLSSDVRMYDDRHAMLIRETCGSARTKPPAAFPSIQVPTSFHRFGYKNTNFSPPMFADGQSASPRLFFDDAGHAFIISPADHFMISEIKTTGSTVDSQFNPQLENLPAGFTHSTLLVEGDTIHEAWENWGKAMTDLTGKHRPANDATVELNKIGYWTDNGATYYYKYDQQRGYEGTMLDIVAAYKKLNIPLGYLQLDSWWYIKSTTSPQGKPGGKPKNNKLPEGSWNCYGGLIEYTAHPFLFPNGLADFDKQLGLPLITHNRWIDPDSFYLQNYKISGIAAVDPKWWDHIADYLKASGVEVYEQDWLNEIYKNSPQFSTTTWAGDAFMDNMARATKERGQRLQYCMGMPMHYLQGSKYDNLTSVRVSDDRFERARWDSMLYVSQMASSLGEWPWVDTFNSDEKPNLILATLTAGPVGFGDDMAKINAANIATCARADGVIVKPDTSIVPLDRTYLSDATDKKSPMVAAAYTNHGAHRTAYVFAYPRNAKQTQIEFTPHDLGFTGDMYVYEPATGQGKLIAGNGTFTSTFIQANPKTAWAYFIAAPVTPAGIALVGDVGKIATAGKKRFTDLTETAGGISARIQFTPSEKDATLIGWSSAKPMITTTGGTAGEMSFDATTHQFQVTVLPAADTAMVKVDLAKPPT